MRGADVLTREREGEGLDEGIGKRGIGERRHGMKFLLAITTDVSNLPHGRDIIRFVALT
jgi:hypothetical protein